MIYCLTSYYSQDINLDAESLFAFMKLERYIPSTVFFTVGLTCSPNIAVINSTVMKKYQGIANEEELEFQAATKAAAEGKHLAKNDTTMSPALLYDPGKYGLIQHNFLSTRLVP